MLTYSIDLHYLQEEKQVKKTIAEKVIAQHLAEGKMTQKKAWLKRAEN